MKRTVLGSQEVPGLGGVLGEEHSRGMWCSGRGCKRTEWADGVYPVHHDLSSPAPLLPAQGLGAKVYRLDSSEGHGRRGTEGRWGSTVGQDPGVSKWPNPEIIRKREECRAGR